MKRCDWATSNLLEKAYHDLEWGVPVHDDRLLFEMLTLESAQAGLSWVTILKKRPAYLSAFDGFDIDKVAEYTQSDIEILLKNSGIIRNRQKIVATVENAKQILKIQAEYGCFDVYIWSFVKGKTIQNSWHHPSDVPASTAISLQMSKALKKRGFKFIGPTICYSFMQATGMVNDHLTNCFRYTETFARDGCPAKNG